LYSALRKHTASLISAYCCTACFNFDHSFDILGWERNLRCKKLPL